MNVLTKTLLIAAELLLGISTGLAKLPQLAKKLRVATDWTLDLFFGREIEQTIIARDIEATAEKIGRVRARTRVTPERLEAAPLAASRSNTYVIR